MEKCLGEQLPTKPGGPPGPKGLRVCHPAVAVLSPVNRRVQLEQGYRSTSSSRMQSLPQPQEGLQADLWKLHGWCFETLPDLLL